MKAFFALVALAAISSNAIAEPRTGGKAGRPASVLPPGHVPVNTALVDLENIKVPKASGANAQTVEEVITNRLELKGKTVLVRGKVVKFTPEILNQNWVHLRDGSGSAMDNTHDVIATTHDQARVGGVVVVKGIVRIDKDIGSGYMYKVLIEEATLQE